MSKTIAFSSRVVVMLTFLIAIPLIAMFGKSLPDFAETVWGYLTKPAEENRWANTDKAPPFNPNATPSPIGAEKTGVKPTPSTLAGTTNKIDPLRTMVNSYVQPNVGSNPESSISSQPRPQIGGGSTSLANSTPITVTPVQPYGSQPFPPSSDGSVRSTPTQQVGAFEQISNRLQTLGATSYHLELWGKGRPLFRFQCQMPVAGSAGLTRQFQTTDQNAVQAMRHVLNQIEVWQQQRQSRSSPNVSIPSVSYAPNALR